MKDANPHLWRWVRAVVAAAGGVTVLVLTITSTDVEVGWRIVYAIAAVVACGYAYQQASLKSRLEQLIANGPGESGYAWIADVTQKTYVVGPIPHSRTDHTPYVFVVTDDVFLRYRTTSVGKVTKEKWADAVPVLIWQSGSYSIVRKADGEILWPAGRHKPVDRQTVASSGSSRNAVTPRPPSSGRYRQPPTAT